MYYDKAYGEFSGIAKILSPQYGQSGSNCEIKFNYYKNDEDIVTFGFYYVSPDGISQKLWSTRSSSKSKTWEEMYIGLNARPPGFRIYFEAVQVADDRASLLAIDDVQFVNCQPHENISCAMPNTFKCANGFCIRNNLVSYQ